jgi:hypothetical protein
MRARLFVRTVFGYAGAFLVGILLLVVFPGFFRATLREVGTIGLPIAIGALGLVTGIFLLVLGVLLLIIGVGAGIAGALAYAPILYVAQVFVGAWLGNKIMGESPVATNAIIGRMAVGLLILRAAALIPILGGLVWLAVWLWGTGAVMLGIYRITRAESAESAPVQPLPA